MISEYLREQKRYTQRDLCDKLHCSEDRVVPIIRKLKEYGILKAVKATSDQKDLTDLVDEDIEVADVEIGEDNYFYVFTFVGIITVAGRVLKCFPKYLINVTEPKNELRKVLKVLEKYNSKEQIIRMFNESSESQSFNLLALLLYLLNDYYENGLYTNSEVVVESNGLGEILWDKTINETFTLLSNNRPYYTDLQTKRWEDDEYDYFKRLHACILTKASKELQEADLLDLFEILEVDLSDEEIDDFGDKDHILYQIEKQLNVQFNSRKQILLKTLYAYISHHGNLNDLDAFSMIGTNSFNLVWENVCSEILDNKLNSRLESLQLPSTLRPGYDKRLKLIDLIEKPLWTVTGKTAADTLIPDLISISDNQFIIFDAKYYNAYLEFGNTPKAQPGIESVTKQYLYQLAYQNFIKEHDFLEVKNCFLMPTEESVVINKGEVTLKMMSDLGLQNIQVRFLPAEMAYSAYLAGRKLDIDILEI